MGLEVACQIAETVTKLLMSGLVAQENSGQFFGKIWDGMGLLIIKMKREFGF